MSFAKNIGKNIGKDISKNLRSKYSLKLLDHTKQSATDALKTTSNGIILKASVTTGDSIGNKIPNKITEISKTLHQNNSVTVTNELDKETPKDRYISPDQHNSIIMEYQKLTSLDNTTNHLNLRQKIGSK